MENQTEGTPEQQTPGRSVGAGLFLLGIACFFGFIGLDLLTGGKVVAALSGGPKPAERGTDDSND